jgi:hypothetical protein
MRRMLRCYAERSHGKWQAFCVDFDLAVQGDSFQEVYAALNVAVTDYVARVHELPEPDRTRLLNRRAPILSRIAFLAGLVRTALRSHGGDDDEKHGYTLPCAA